MRLRRRVYIYLGKHTRENKLAGISCSLNACRRSGKVLKVCSRGDCVKMVYDDYY